MQLPAPILIELLRLPIEVVEAEGLLQDGSCPAECELGGLLVHHGKLSSDPTRQSSHPLPRAGNHLGGGEPGGTGWVCGKPHSVQQLPSV